MADSEAAQVLVPSTRLGFYHPDDAGLAEDAWGTWSRLRDESPIFRTSPEGEATRWYVCTYAGMKEVIQHPNMFSSNDIINAAGGTPYSMVPGELDPPDHTKYRRLVNPPFSPGAIRAWEPEMRRLCIQLIESFAEKGDCELMADFALKFPTTIFLRIMGMPIERTPEFVDLCHRWTWPSSMEDRLKVERLIDEALLEAYEGHRRVPADDVVGYLVTCEVDGRPLTNDELLAIGRLLFIAGMDTVASTLGWSFLHFAQHDDVRLRLVNDPSAAEKTVEECLRYYAILTAWRVAREGATVGGCPINRGDFVVVPLAPANLDGDQFPNPEIFDIDRDPNRQVAFGLGPHRCLGSHLARAELRIAFEEWHRLVPEYRVREGVTLEHGVGNQVTMLNSLPLVWDV